MADTQLIVLPVCIKKKDDICKIYIPDIDFQCRAVDYSGAVAKARKMIQASFTIGELSMDDLPEDICSSERVLSLVKNNQKDEFLDADVLFVDVYLNENEIHGVSDVTMQVPKTLLDAVMAEGIDYESIFRDSIEEVLRRKTLLNLANKLIGHTVEVKTFAGSYLGEIKAISHGADDPWNFTLGLKTGLYNTESIRSGAIEDIDEIPLIINKMGTFRLINQEGFVSLAGTLWWKANHIDVYLEYNPLLDIDEQAAIEHLSEFNEIKYILDDNIRGSIIPSLMKDEMILELFRDKENSTIADSKYIISQLFDRLNLWFIDLSSKGELYMDYNFRNENGSFSVGVKTQLNQESISFKLNEVNIFNDDFFDEDDLLS